MIQPGKYGGIYWVYGSKNWMDGDDLEEVVSSIAHMSDNGDCAYDSDEFYVLTDEGWENIDESIVEAEFDKRWEEEQKRYEGYRNKAELTPWAIVIEYPSGKEVWSRYKTEAEANTDLKAMPKGITASVVNA